MKLIIKKSFEEDIKNVDKWIIKKILKLIDFIEKNDFIDFINIFDVKKIKWYKKYYRVRIWDYRIWILYDDTNLYLVRIKLRKDIYKIFP